MYQRILQFIANVIRDDEHAWERGANPWSVWTRIATWPLLMLALWSLRLAPVEALVSIVLLAGWLWLNSRIFPPPLTTKSWAARTIMGERAYVLRSLHPIPLYHGNALTLLGIGTWLGGLLMAAGLLAAEPATFIVGCVTAALCRFWFLDRLVWLFDDMAREVPEYRAWLR